MTKKQKTAIRDLNREFTANRGRLEDIVKQVGELYVSHHGGERPSSSIRHMCEYLITSEDKALVERAWTLYRDYHFYDGERNMFNKMFQLFADTGLDWHI